MTKRRRMCSFVFIEMFFSWQNKSQSEIVYISKYLHKPKIISTILESNLSKKIRPKPTTSMNIYVEIYTMTSRSSNNSTSNFFHFFSFPRLPNVTSALRLAAILRRVRWPWPILRGRKRGWNLFVKSEVTSTHRVWVSFLCLTFSLAKMVNFGSLSLLNTQGTLDSFFKWNQRPLDRWSCGWRLYSFPVKMGKGHVPIPHGVSNALIEYIRDNFINKPLQGSLLNTQYFAKSNGPLVLNLSHLSVFITTQLILCIRGIQAKFLHQPSHPPNKNHHIHMTLSVGCWWRPFPVGPFRWTKMTSPRALWMPRDCFSFNGGMPKPWGPSPQGPPNKKMEEVHPWTQQKNSHENWQIANVQ